MYNFVYQRMGKEIKSTMNCSEKVLKHNQKAMRDIFDDWADERIIVGSISEWNRKANSLHRTKDLKTANLFMDALELKMSGRSPYQEVMNHGLINVIPQVLNI